MPTSYFQDFPSKGSDRLLLKWEHYLRIYDTILAPLQGRDIRFLEIGVFRGGSISMWKGFLGTGAQLTFLDINPSCKDLALPGTTVEIGDQADPEFLRYIGQKYGPFDLIIDDGGHQMTQQINSFKYLWPALQDGGKYIVEDVHTSYWPGFGGGFRAPGSFIEFCKDLIDRMNSWYTEDDVGFPLHPYASELGGLQFYDSVVVIEKGLKEPPVEVIAENGQVLRTRRALSMRGRYPAF